MENHDNQDVDLTAELGLHFPRESNDQSQDFADINNASSSSATTSSNFSIHDTVQSGKSSDDIGAALFTHLSAFSSTVFRNQSEISGIAFAVAEYIAWMRKVPPGVVPPNANLVYLGVLETIENRLRELREIAQTRHHAAFREMMAAIEGLGLLGSGAALNLRELDKELQKGTADLLHFFQTRYNASALLSDQVQNMPQGFTANQGSNRSSQSASSD